MKNTTPAKNKITKLISLFLIISILAPSVLLSRPKKAEAWVSTILTDIASGIGAAFTGIGSGAQVTDTSISVKNVSEEITRHLLMAIARKALQEMTKSTINWINSGFHGSPLFLENQQSFFQDIAKSEVRNLVDIFGYDSLKFPFGKDFALNTINAYKSRLEDNTAYTLSKVMTEPEARNYRSDFGVSGWNGFLINTQHPQNNELGFQMVATEELARRVQGTAQNAVAKVQTALAQGQGFLSPKSCPTNEKYNNLVNEFHQPSFNPSKFESDYARDIPPPSCDFDENVDPDDCLNQINEWQRGKENSLSAAEKAWAETNECPGGLVSTTPGSVVANQVMTATSSSFRQSELGAALGNSLSAVFDALINKLADEGLNALKSTINPPPEDDDWSYNGLTLGSAGEGGVNATWDMGPEEPIVLDAFKKTIDDGITNTTLELLLMSNGSATEPGITQLLGQVWPKARELDICIPGPDMGWQDRLTKEMVRNSKKLSEKATEEEGEKAAQADLVLKELEFATNFFKDWVNNKMMTELPNSILYMDAVDEIKKLSQQSDELTDRKRGKTQAVARLTAIKTNLAAITTQPEPGSEQDRYLVLLWKQYKAVSSTVSSTISVESTRNELAIAKEKLVNLGKMIAQCSTERVAKGWGTPGGATSSFSGPSAVSSSSSSKINGIAINSEQAIFCSLPIIGGFNHESFKNTTGITHPFIPLVNADNVLTYKIGGGFLGLETEQRRVDIKMSCNVIFKANLLDYKGNLPGFTPVSESYQELPDDTGGDLPEDPGPEPDPETQ